MQRTLSLKSDFERTVQRFEAWWRGELLDRPPVTLNIEPQRPYQGPTSRHNTWRECWLDVEYQVDAQLARLAQHDYVGDSFPRLVPNVGPVLTAALLGGELSFDEHTSWAVPNVTDITQWHALRNREPDFESPYWRAVEAMTDLALDKASDQCVVGVTDLHGNFDTLAALRGSEALCEDLVDAPDLMQQVGMHAAHVFTSAFNRLWTRIHARGLGCTTWAPLYHEGPCYLPSCDFWCLVGPTAADVIAPAIKAEMQPLQRTLFHLDGPDALRHLDRILAWPELDAVQWVYGVGAGPATRWLDVYRRIRQADKSVQILAEAEDALWLLEQLGPRGLWLTITTPFTDADAAQRYLDEVARRCSTHVSSNLCTGY